MKVRILLYAACCLAFGWLTACAHSQVPPNLTTYACPATNAALYAPLNQASPATGLAYTDSKPAAGVYCVIAQSVAASAVSLPSNVAGPFTTNGTNSIQLSWTAPTSGVTPTGYVISVANAIQSTIVAPNLGTGTVAFARDIPAFDLKGQVREGQ